MLFIKMDNDSETLLKVTIFSLCCFFFFYAVKEDIFLSKLIIILFLFFLLKQTNLYFKITNPQKNISQRNQAVEDTINRLQNKSKNENQTIQKLKQKFTLKNTDDVVKLYQENNKAFDSLNTYCNKIHELHGETLITLEIFWDPSYHDGKIGSIVLNIEKTIDSIEEWRNKNQEMLDWKVSQREFLDKESKVIVRSKLSEKCSEELFQEFVSDF